MGNFASTDDETDQGHVSAVREVRHRFRKRLSFLDALEEGGCPIFGKEDDVAASLKFRWLAR